MWLQKFTKNCATKCPCYSKQEQYDLVKCFYSRYRISAESSLSWSQGFKDTDININAQHCCVTLSDLHTDIKRKHPSMLRTPCCPTMPARTDEGILCCMCWPISYIPDLSLCSFHVFRPINKELNDPRFGLDKDIKWCSGFRLNKPHKRETQHPKQFTCISGNGVS